MKSQKGGVMIVLSITIIFAWTLMAMTLLMMAAQYRTLNRLAMTTSALHVAEGGVAKALWELSRGAGYSGEKDTSLDIGTFSVEVRSEEGRTVILSTGYIPNRLKPQAAQTIRVAVAGGGTPLSWRRR